MKKTTYERLFYPPIAHEEFLKKLQKKPYAAVDNLNGKFISLGVDALLKKRVRCSKAEAVMKVIECYNAMPDAVDLFKNWIGGVNSIRGASVFGEAVSTAGMVYNWHKSKKANVKVSQMLLDAFLQSRSKTDIIEGFKQIKDSEGYLINIPKQNYINIEKATGDEILKSNVGFSEFLVMQYPDELVKMSHDELGDFMELTEEECNNGPFWLVIIFLEGETTYVNTPNRPIKIFKPYLRVLSKTDIGKIPFKDIQSVQKKPTIQPNMVYESTMSFQFDLLWILKVISGTLLYLNGNKDEIDLEFKPVLSKNREKYKHLSEDSNMDWQKLGYKKDWELLKFYKDGEWLVAPYMAHRWRNNSETGLKERFYRLIAGSLRQRSEQLMCVKGKENDF